MNHNNPSFGRAAKAALSFRSSGFTLIELLVVISIIGLLASVVLVSLSSSRAKARDVKRVGDMNQIAKALELFYNERNHFPTSGASIGTGGLLSSSTAPNLDKFIAVFPTAPQPADSPCTSSAAAENNNVYWYRTDNGGTRYTITFCLGTSNPGNIGTGVRYLTPGGFR